MRGIVLLFTLHFGARPAGDRWFGADKFRHFAGAAFVQSVTFSGLRFAGLGRSESLVGASVVAAGVSVGKEIADSRAGAGSGRASAKDLAWDAGGILAASLLLERTER